MPYPFLGLFVDFCFPSISLFGSSISTREYFRLGVFFFKTPSLSFSAPTWLFFFNSSLPASPLCTCLPRLPPEFDDPQIGCFVVTHYHVLTQSPPLELSTLVPLPHRVRILVREASPRLSYILSSTFFRFFFCSSPRSALRDQFAGVARVCSSFPSPPLNPHYFVLPFGFTLVERPRLPPFSPRLGPLPL